MLNDIVTAIALVLVIEGILPFAAPAVWRETISQIAQLPNNVLRGVGLACMLSGVVLLYIIN